MIGTAKGRLKAQLRRSQKPFSRFSDGLFVCTALFFVLLPAVFFVFHAHGHEGVQAAVVGAGDGEQQRRQGDFVAAHGQAAEFLNDQPADGVGFFVAVIRAEKRR